MPPPADGSVDPYRDLAGALHDVSNALTVILGWVAEARGAEGQQVAHALQMIEERARAARDLSRRAIGASPPTPPEERVLDDVVVDVAAALAIEAQRAGVRIEVREAKSSARVAAASDLSEVLTNLVLNALAFAPRGSAVFMEVGAAEAKVVVSVRDEGPGIEAERAARLFDGSSTRAGGAGVGLRHARAVARARGGDLSFVAGEGPGARFQVSWPRGVAPRHFPASSSRLPLLAGRRVLVLEDDPDVAVLLETALGARGASVTLAKSASELPDALRAQHDAALLDLSPIVDDVEGALGELRKVSPHARLVFISGSAAGLPEALHAEGVRWVRKPFEIGEVVAALTDDAPPASTKKP